jgi:hypothetical protein
MSMTLIPGEVRRLSDLGGDMAAAQGARTMLSSCGTSRISMCSPPVDLTGSHVVRNRCLDKIREQRRGGDTALMKQPLQRLERH